MSEHAEPPSDALALPKLAIAVPGVGIYIKYRGDEGVTSHKLTVKRLWAASLRNTLIVLSIDAFCHIHQDEMSFDCSSLAGAWEHEGGSEVWDPVGWILAKTGEISLSAMSQTKPVEPQAPLNPWLPPAMPDIG